MKLISSSISSSDERGPRRFAVPVAVYTALWLCVLDLPEGAQLSQSAQSRLLGLAQRHAAAVLCLTQKAESAPSLGSLVSLRASAVRVWLGSDRFACELRVHKDKRRGPVWSQREVYRGPLGLR